MGSAILPTGDGFGPAGRDSTSMMVVSGKLRAAKVSMAQGAVVAATGSGASAPVAIMAVESTRRKKRRLIRHLLLWSDGLKTIVIKAGSCNIIFQ
jgi:hypothetical protein